MDGVVEEPCLNWVDLVLIPINEKQLVCSTFGSSGTVLAKEYNNTVTFMQDLIWTSQLVQTV